MKQDDFSQRTKNLIFAWAYGIYVALCFLVVFTVDTGTDTGDTITQITITIFAVLPMILWGKLRAHDREREEREFQAFLRQVESDTIKKS